MSPQRRHELAKRARDASRFYGPRRVIEATGGPLAYLVSKIDDLGFRAIHAVRDGFPPKDKVLKLRTYFRIAGMFPPWVRRTLDDAVSRWLTAIRRAHRVILYLEGNAFDEFDMDYVPAET